jgi:tetratricopeptide (TPR) repeat protein
VEREVWDLCGYYPAARPAAAKILVDLAEAQLKVSHLEEVRRLTEAVARELPEQEEECVRARVVAARALRQSGDVEGAAIALRAVIEEQPTQPWAGGAALELAGLSRERHDPATAEGSYRWVLEHHQDSEWAAAAAQGLPALLVETEQVKEALAELETLAEQFANRPDVAAEAWIAAGDALCAAARVEQGRQLYQEVAQRFPTAREPSARAALHLAESYQTTGQEEEAAPRFAQLRQDFPELWEAGAAGLHLGRYYARQKDYDRAVEVWQQVLQAFPQVGWLAAPSLKELGLAYKETGEFEKSEEVLLRLRDEYAQEVDEAASAQLHLGYLYEKQGLYEKAEAAPPHRRSWNWPISTVK